MSIIIYQCLSSLIVHAVVITGKEASEEEVESAQVCSTDEECDSLIDLDSEEQTESSVGTASATDSILSEEFSSSSAGVVQNSKESFATTSSMDVTTKNATLEGQATLSTKIATLEGQATVSLEIPSSDSFTKTTIETSSNKGQATTMSLEISSSDSLTETNNMETSNVTNESSSSAVTLLSESGKAEIPSLKSTPFLINGCGCRIYPL